MNNRPSNGQIAAIGIELVVFAFLSYFGVKWISKVLDPTSKQKEAAQKQVRSVYILFYHNIKYFIDIVIISWSLLI